MKPLIALLALAFTSLLSAAAPAKPNIVFILADDLGLDGVSCYGSDDHPTPNIDALAASGTRFTTCYAAPLCGPSRCLFNTGRYAFRTGGLQNGSWRANGPGAKSKDERPIAAQMKQAGYATGQSGKWRQVGETPKDWGFDEYMTDPTAGGWFYQKSYFKNGEEIKTPEVEYNPDQIQAFSLDFIQRHKDGPFFLYYAMHLVHKPTLHTPDSKDKKDGAEKYQDTIAYMDKQVGLLVAELDRLGIRNNTLVLFSGDNGTAVGYPSPIKGRLINGAKASMLEGGSRVPLIASWPGVTPAGRVNEDIVSFADMLPTFVDLGGGTLPADFPYDGHSFAPQIKGQPGTPRDWAYVQLGSKWFVREKGFKMNQAHELFDMSDAPFVEKPIAPAADTDASKAARTRLTDVLAQLNPAAGKGDADDAPKMKKGKKGKGKKKAKAAAA